MEARTRNLLIAGGLAIIAMIVIVNLGQREPVHVDVDDTDPVIGTGNLTVVLFEDYQCSHCRDYALGPNYQHLLDTWVEPGHVQVVFKHVAFVGPHSERAAIASRCVASIDADAWPQWDHDVYERQALGGQPDEEGLALVTRNNDIDMDAYESCIADPDVAAAIDANKDEWQQLGVGTPAIVVAGQVFNPNDTASVDAAIQEAL